MLNVGHCHPAGRRRRPRAGGAAHPRHQPLLHRPGDAAVGAAVAELARRQGVPLQLRRRGQRGGDQARPPGPARRQARSSCEEAFHGRTYGALSATPQESKQAPFAPLVPGFEVVPKDPDALDGGGRRRHRGRAAGADPGRDGHPSALRRSCCRPRATACDRTGAALIFDEIQTGMGRTGTLWAYEQTGVVPDAMTSAKALGGGLPIGALITGPRLADVLQPGDHGSTFAGGPLVCRAPHSWRLRSAPIRTCWRACGRSASGCARAWPRCRVVRTVRGRGLMVGVDLAGRRVGPRARPPRAARAAAGAQRDRPGHHPLRAAADRREAEIDEALGRLGELTVSAWRPAGQGRRPARLRPACRRGRGGGAAPAADGDHRQRRRLDRAARTTSICTSCGSPSAAHAPSSASWPASSRRRSCPGSAASSAGCSRPPAPPGTSTSTCTISARCGDAAGVDPGRPRSAAPGAGPQPAGRPRRHDPGAAMSGGRPTCSRIGIGCWRAWSSCPSTTARRRAVRSASWPASGSARSTSGS